MKQTLFFLLVLIVSFTSCVKASTMEGVLVFVSGRQDKHSSLFMIEKGHLRVIMKGVYDPKWSNAGNRILASSDKGLFVFDKKGKLIDFRELKHRPSKADWMGDSKAVFGSDGNVYVYDFSDGSETQVLSFSDGKIIGDIDVNPDGKKILIWRFEFAKGENHQIVFDPAKGKYEEVPYSGRWSPDGKMVVTASQRGMFIYDAETQKEIRKIELPFYGSDPAFSPDGKQIVFNGTWSGIYVINIDGTGLKTILKPDPRGKNDVSFDWAA